MTETVTKLYQGRGQLTQRIKDKSKELLGYEINVRELRLMPYIQYSVTNFKTPDNINQEEEEILAKWLKRGHITQGVTPKGRVIIGEKFKITKEFWDILSEIVYLGYVDLSE